MGLLFNPSPESAGMQMVAQKREELCRKKNVVIKRGLSVLFHAKEESETRLSLHGSTIRLAVEFAVVGAVHTLYLLIE